MEVEQIITGLDFNYLTVLKAFLVAIVGFYVTRKLKNLVLEKLVIHTKDKTVSVYLVNLIYILSVFVTGIIILNILGFPTTTLLTMLGALGLAVALAVKDFISNFVAGFILVIYGLHMSTIKPRIY